MVEFCELQRSRQLEEWNEPPSTHVNGQCIHELFEAHVRKTPDAIALIYGNQELSYRELDLRSNRLAHILKKNDAGTGALVGVGIERSFDMIISILAILKAGGAYVPLDPAYPAARLQYMIEHSGLKLVLTQASLRECWNKTSIICVDELADNGDVSPLEQVYAKGLAYVIYTSGSTGTPKGVMGHHQGLCNLALWQNQVLKAASGSRILQFASLSFDAATWEITMALCTGAALILAHRDVLTSASALAQLIETQQISHATISPTMLALLSPNNCPLKVVISAGEACSEALVKSWASVCMFVNAYGPTESTVCATMKVCEPNSIGRPSIGRPITNHRVYILDQHHQLVVPGESGELYIGGVGVALGYLHDETLSAEKFVEDPFYPDERMYRTGDRGRYCANGEIDFLGRMDDQIKLRGYRIELGEIEAALITYPGIKSVAVILREDKDSPKCLVAYIASPEHLSSKALRTHLQDQLPDYMIPSAFVIMTSLPLTPNGKINRRDLPAPQGRVGLSGEYIAPRTSAELSLSKIWAGVLQCDQVGIHDNFFELGGHSLLAIKILARVKIELGVELTLSTLFNAPSVAQMATLLTEALDESAFSYPPINVRSAGSVIPLSPEQKQIWFASQVCDDPSAFNVPIGLNFQGPLDAVVLKQSLTALVMRHEVLRTSFALVSGVPQQIVQTHSSFKLTVVPIYALPEAMQKQQADKAKDKESGKAFDLLAGPLFRGTLLVLGEQEHSLLLSSHHLVFDGWSHTLFVQELFEIYQAKLAEREPELVQLEVQFGDYVLWQQALLEGERRQQLEQYWIGQLRGYKTDSELSTDFERPPFRSYQGVAANIIVPEALLQPLRSLTRQFGVSSYMTLLSAFYVLLMRQTGHSDFVVGGTAANRHTPAIQGVIGLFVNMVPLRINTAGYTHFGTLLGGVRDVVLAAEAHQDLPFEQLVQALHLPHDPSRMPLFQSVFRYETMTAAKVIGQTGLSVQTFNPDSASVKLDLEIVATESDDALVISVQYDIALFSAEYIDTLLRNYINTLELVVSEPETAFEHMEFHQ
ncbi:hypothetical protein CKQ84_08425 [Shewanella sp. WE21]|uniref:non-ribosomal peptide synthetase n=1 Tax=Shewanella sp. WE21 TaxID=2029986 RepID=UPI000CF7334E|nr:non-ribosomal peptide synthetase [Shewanella sp. WE21]AVI65894.1 hypothetical protein CKQ84_08425 [Shewanella sp. WE21]